MLLQEGGEVDFSDETDPLGVFTLCGSEVFPAGDFAHFGFQEVPDGEEGFGQLCLAELAEKIALVLVRVAACEEAVYRKATDQGFLFPAIVACGDIVGSCFEHFIEEDIEFDFAVAENIGIWSAPGLVFCEHIVHDTFSVVFAEIDDAEGDVQFFCHHFRNQGVVLPGARTGKGSCTVVPVDHKET